MVGIRKDCSKKRCMMVNITVVCHTYLLQILRQVIVAADLHCPNLEHIGTIVSSISHRDVDESREFSIQSYSLPKDETL